jgi:hypothetical protein
MTSARIARCVLISLCRPAGRREAGGPLAVHVARGVANTDLRFSAHCAENLTSRSTVIGIDDPLDSVDSCSVDIFVKVVATLTTDQLVSVLSIWEPR